MKFTTVICVAVAACVQPALAHYRFTSLIVNGATTGEYQYVRQNSNYNSPASVGSTDTRCNAGGSNGANTQTATVAAGATVGFKMDQPIYHPGPVVAYISKAPNTAATYDGSGAWAKIWEQGVTQFPPPNGGSAVWYSDNKGTFTFPLPSSLAAGEYLVRMEQIALHSTGSPQLYISCGQIKVTGGGSAVPSGTGFPAKYSMSDPGLKANIWTGFQQYTIPGGAVWRG